MRRDVTAWVLVLAATTATAPRAVAQDAARKAAATAPAKAVNPNPNPPDPARMRQLLVAWERQSARLKTLDVQIRRLDKSPAWGEEQYAGRAILKAPNFAWLDFKKVVAGKDPKTPDLVPHERIVCTGAEVWQYKSDVKQIFIFPLDRQNQKRALEEGPLPFLFNMKAADAEARYVMALIDETAEDFIISVVPRLKIDQESFSKAFVKLNRKTFLPDRIYLVSPDGNSTKDFKLFNVQPNPKVMDENFKGVVLPKPWVVVRDPDGGAAPERPQGVGTRPTANPGRRAR